MIKDAIIRYGGKLKEVRSEVRNGDIPPCEALTPHEADFVHASSKSELCTSGASELSRWRGGRSRVRVCGCSPR